MNCTVGSGIPILNPDDVKPHTVLPHRIFDVGILDIVSLSHPPTMAYNETVGKRLPLDSYQLGILAPVTFPWTNDLVNAYRIPFGDRTWWGEYCIGPDGKVYSYQDINSMHSSLEHLSFYHTVQEILYSMGINHNKTLIPNYQNAGLILSAINKEGEQIGCLIGGASSERNVQMQEAINYVLARLPHDIKQEDLNNLKRIIASAIREPEVNVLREIFMMNISLRQGYMRRAAMVLQLLAESINPNANSLPKDLPILAYTHSGSPIGRVLGKQKIPGLNKKPPMRLIDQYMGKRNLEYQVYMGESTQKLHEFLMMVISFLLTRKEKIYN